MKLPNLLSRLMLVLGSVLSLGTSCDGADAARSPSREELIPTEAERNSRLGWWREARFGMFVHWGVYSSLSGTWQGKKYGGYGEHLQRMAKIPIPVYRTEVAGNFNPTDFNADEWIRLAKEAGMGYFVITAKHHVGFAMYDSQVSRYNIVKATPFARDPMKELSAACKKYGLKFGFYYSHAFDWGEENGPGNDWDYPNPGGDKLLHGADWWLNYPQFLPKARKNVDEKSIPQLLELIRKYDPDIIWFDTPHKLPPEENLRILAAVRKAKPSLVINGRLVSGCGDYASTCDRLAEFPPQAGDWEGVPTTNESYGYNQNDRSHKPVAHFIQLLAKSAARGGNELMNIGPMGNGRIDEADVSILHGIGRWWQVNGESMRGTTRTPLAVQAWGESTRKGNELYLHGFEWPRDGKLVVGGLKTEVVKARLLTGGRENLSVIRSGMDVTVAVPATPPDRVNSVVVLECAGEPQGDPGRLLALNVQTNVLRSFDANLKGALRYGPGKISDACVNNWKSAADEVAWPVRLNQAGTFEATVVYDAPAGLKESRIQEGTNQPMTGDTDGDGFVFADELVRGYSPVVPDAIADGEIMMRLSDVGTYRDEAQQKRYEIRSEPQGIVTSQSGYVTNGTLVNTPAIPYGSSSGEYSFGYWEVNGVRQASGSGISLPAIVLPLTNDTVAIARYIASGDNDGDGMQDWQELYWFGNTNYNQTSDPDSDGFVISEELVRGYNLAVRDDLADGGIMMRLSDAGTYRNEAVQKRYEILSDPQGIVTRQSGYVTNGTLVNTPSIPYGSSSGGYYFGYWEVNGVRQASGSGISLPAIVLTMTNDVQAIARYIVSGDGDGDGMQDWQELYWFGNTNYNQMSDPDGDGFVISEELARGYNLAVRDGIADGGIMMRLSDMGTYRSEAVQKRYEIRSDPQGIVTSQSGYVTNGALVNTPSIPYGSSSGGYYFGYWEVNGARQASGSGISLPAIVLTMTNDVLAIARYITSGDNDGDGMQDWQERYWFGNTNYNQTSDPDGDGFVISEKLARGYNLAVKDTIADGGIMMRMSDAGTVALAGLPVAIANRTVTCLVDDTVALDGSRSRNANTYFWQVTGRPDLSTATIVNESYVQALFTPDVAGIYTIELVVGSGAATSPPATVTVFVSPAPLHASCPGDVLTNADWGRCFASAVNLGAATVAGGFGTEIVTNDVPLQFPVGTNTVTWVAVGPISSTTICAQSVVVVDNAPFIIAGPQSVATNEGATVTFAVASTVCTPLAYQWRRNGVDLSNSPHVQGVDSRTLVIANALDSDVGVYEVVLSNLTGVVTSSPPAVLAVTNLPMLVTASPLPPATANLPYTQAMEIRGGVAPFAWSVASGSLPAGLELNVTNGVIAGVPSEAGDFIVGVRATDFFGVVAERTLSLTVRTAEYGFSAVQSMPPYVSPGTNKVSCQISCPEERQLYYLLWQPVLPPGWTLLSASGDGMAEAQDGEIIFTDFNLGTTLNFSYTVVIAAGQTNTNMLSAAVTYLMNGMEDATTVMASPEPLAVQPAKRHSADYESLPWVVDGAEVSWVLAYWRAQHHHLQTNARDGFAVGTGNTNGVRHDADFQEPFWVMDGTEVNRVLAYWRARAYHPEATGVDGYAPGPMGGDATGDSGAKNVLRSSAFGSLVCAQSGPELFTPGGTLQITNTITCRNPLLSLLWRPVLPTGWTIKSVTGSGHPELVAGDIVWTGALPTNLIQMVYAVQAAPGDRTACAINADVEYQTAGMVNAARFRAALEAWPLSTVKFQSISVQGDRITLSLQGEAGRRYAIQASTNLQTWSQVTNVAVTADVMMVQDAITVPKCFYRAMLLEQ